MVLFVATLFIPFAIEIPFLTERYQDIFRPYASGIRSAFFGTVWVMTSAMIVSIPVSIGAAGCLEEYAAPTRTYRNSFKHWLRILLVFLRLFSVCSDWLSSLSKAESEWGSGLRFLRRV